MTGTTLRRRVCCSILLLTVIKGLRTTIYKVPDLAQAKAWYSQAFGITPYFDEPFYVGFNVGGFELGLDPDAPAANHPGGVLTYWAVDDVDAAYSRLIGLGATRHEEPKEVGSGIKVATVLDPFGNIIGLIFNPHFDAKAVQ
jgi:predicted enzyme related to lactoylglutathione lyase